LAQPLRFWKIRGISALTGELVSPQSQEGEILPGITAMVVDRATSMATILTSDGKAFSFPHVFPAEPSSNLSRITHLPNAYILIFETRRGDKIEVDLPSHLAPAPHLNRPVVYLDQKDWSLLANALHDPDKIRSTNERRAAQQLIQLALAKKIILPMSMGHLGETARWTDSEKRYRLALTVIQLSRGWQMRHPLSIRRYELSHALSWRFDRNPPPPRHNFTLEPCSAEHEPPPQQFEELPPSIAYAAKAMSCISSYFDAILDSQSVPTNPVPAWVQMNQEFTEWLSSDGADASLKRKSILSHFRMDLEPELLQAVYESGITSAELEAWREAHFREDIRAMPSLGLFTEVFQDKHLDPSTTWRDNDLIDMIFLTCAAGYADYVVGERSLVGYIKQAANRLRRPIRVHSQVGELVAELQGTVR
jgi:hypothetical protein